MKKTLREHKLHPWAAGFIYFFLGVILVYLIGTVASVAMAKVGEYTASLHNAYKAMEYAAASLFLAVAGGLLIDVLFAEKNNSHD